VISRKFLKGYYWANRNQELYKATNGGSKYRFDPDFGGKLNLRDLQRLERQLSPPNLPEKPRISEPKVESRYVLSSFLLPCNSEEFN
jgi:hypothetical protein